MRIGLDLQSTLGAKTGIGSYTHQLLGAMRRVAPQHTYVELSLGRDVVMRLDRRLYWQQGRLPVRARSAGVEILHVTGFDAPAWHHCPVVLTVHDLIGSLFPQNLPPVARFYWSRWLPFSVRFATHIIADSDQTRQDIIRLLGISEARITVVPLAAGAQYQPLPADNAAVSATRQKYGLDRPYVLFVSTIEPRKGLDTLIDAFSRIHADDPRLSLVIAGKRGWYTEQLFAQARNSGLASSIIFTGYVADEDLPALYNGAEVLGFPSRYEGFGLTVLEAMACGTPVVCSNNSSLPEVAGSAALMVPPNQPQELADALLQVLTDSTIRAELRNRGLAQAARFSWERTAALTLEVYERLCA